MISWSGLGIFALAILAACAGAGTGIADLLGQSASGANLGTSIGFVVGGVAVWFAGSALNRPKPGYDRSTGRPVLSVNRHRLMGIPMQYYALTAPMWAVLTFNQAIHS
ncbi:hypothetical protein ACQPXH_20480 [Nocardia sp. CA-135953]|uniref:hypothetical protein n=1 Tax=Nocardia sp. CA-135953 TaxID=3239978 RepID=UPI003D96A3BE